MTIEAELLKKLATADAEQIVALLTPEVARLLVTEAQQAAEMRLWRERMRSYRGIEAWPCWLCRYENGYFIKRCSMHEKMDEQEKVVDRLQAAIRKHRDQKGHDRCFLDDDELYGVLPEGHASADRNLPPKEEFIAGCNRYYDLRSTGVSHDHCSLPNVLTDLSAEKAHADHLAECLDLALAMDTSDWCALCRDSYCECEAARSKETENARIISKCRAAVAAHKKRRAP